MAGVRVVLGRVDLSGGGGRNSLDGRHLNQEARALVYALGCTEDNSQVRNDVCSGVE